MALLRRRPRSRCPIAGLCLAASVLLLLLSIAVLSYLAPPLSDTPAGHDDLLLASSSKILRNASRRDLAVEERSWIPVDGGRSKTLDMWESKFSNYYYGCSNESSNFLSAEAVTARDRYLMIATSGGLNQQRTGITDAVVAARILNATLIVPMLDRTSFWKDASNFEEIFDVDWFISFLSKDVKIKKELPKFRVKKKFVKGAYSLRIPRKCTARCYQNRVLPVLQKKHVVRLTKFDYRLANRLEMDLQKLRCRVNYHALRFTDQIQQMGELLVHRMREKGEHFIALHLRYEQDMLAFSGCYYGGGEKEMEELSAIRKRWKTLHITNPDKARRQGRCPLTPEEVGLMLRALGFGSDVNMYVASGEIYRREESLAPLKALFPNLHSKETLASKEELEPFSSFSSRMAALDFIVCDGSDAFVTNNNGNMARILAGRRRYFGHKRTIRPNAKKLYSLFLNRANMTWEEFASKVRTYQKGFMGEPKEVRAGRGEFHENPTSCICETAEAALQSRIHRHKQHKESDSVKANAEEPAHDDANDERYSSDLDYRDAQTVGNFSSTTDVEYDLSVRREYSELDDILSD